MSKRNECKGTKAVLLAGKLSAGKCWQVLKGYAGSEICKGWSVGCTSQVAGIHASWQKGKLSLPAIKADGPLVSRSGAAQRQSPRRRWSARSALQPPAPGELLHLQACRRCRL